MPAVPEKYDTGRSTYEEIDPTVGDWGIIFVSSTSVFISVIDLDGI
jgi:hypothetical protein